MRQRRGHESWLRWYPAEWRARYGDELEVLLEDTYGDGPVPIGVRLSLVRAGSVERLRRSGLASPNGARGRVRSGALIVLCAWAVVVWAGMVMAKTSEHWSAATPPGRPLPGAGYAVVQWAARAGAVAVMLAAGLSLPSIVRGGRRGGWERMLRPVVRAAALTVVTGLVGAAVVVWAHHLDGPQRNGAYWPYTVVAVVGAVMVAAVLGSWVAATVAVVVPATLPDRVLRACGVLTLATVAAIACVLGGTLTWWFGGGATGPVPVALVASTLLMACALGVAAWGGRRVLRSMPDLAHR